MDGRISILHSLTCGAHLHLPHTQAVYYLYSKVALDPIPCCWGVESGQVDLVSGQGHTNLVCTMKATAERLYSLGLDKSLKTTELASNEFRYMYILSLACTHTHSLSLSLSLSPSSGAGLTLAGLDPTGMAITSDEMAIVSTLTEVGDGPMAVLQLSSSQFPLLPPTPPSPSPSSQVVLVRGGERVGSLTVNYHPQCVAVHPSLPEVAVAGQVRLGERERGGEVGYFRQEVSRWRW